MKSYARVSPSNNCVYSFYLGEGALCRISFLTTWKRSLRNFHQPGPCETSCSSLLPFPAGAWKEAKELGGYLKFLHNRQLKKLPLGFEANLSQVCVFVFAFYHFMFFFRWWTKMMCRPILMLRPSSSIDCVWFLLTPCYCGWARMVPQDVVLSLWPGDLSHPTQRCMLLTLLGGIPYKSRGFGGFEVPLDAGTGVYTTFFVRLSWTCCESTTSYDLVGVQSICWLTTLA